MAVRVRADGRVLCAAMHEVEPDDRAYLDDGLHYKLSVQLGALVTEPMHADPDDPGRGGHAAHGEWWWCDEVPDDVLLEPPVGTIASPAP